MRSLPRWTPDLSKLRRTWQGCSSRLLSLLLDPAALFETFGYYEDKRIRFEEWQVAHLHDYNQLRAREKSPQIGFSWLCAAEALHEAILYEDADTGFVSVDLREAKNKILYAKKLYDGLPEFVQRAVPIATESVDELALGDARRPSRLTSFPASAGIRGRPMNVVLDEADFYADGGTDAFRAGLTRLIRGPHLRLTMGGTVFGSGTKLDKVMHENEDTRFSRAVFPYTVVEDDARREGIEAFMGELDEDEAIEEFMCVRGGGATDSFPPALIRASLSPFEPVASTSWNPTGPAVVGADIGKSRHPTIVVGLEQMGHTWQPRVIEQPEMGGQSLTLPQQQDYLDRLMEQIPTLVLAVDVSGLGQQINDYMSSRYGSRFIAINSSSTEYARARGLPPMGRYELATEVKRALEASEVALPTDRSLMQQFGSTQLSADRKVIQPGSKRSTHYDRFWSFCYAWYAANARRAVRSVYANRGLIVVGGEGGDAWRRLVG